MSRLFRIFPLSLALVLSLAAAEPATLKVLMENASPPFVVQNARGRPEGFAVELIETVAAEQGFRVEFDLRPWQEVYPDFLQGKGDILGLVAYSEERATRMDFSLPCEVLVCALYSHRGQPALVRPADLRGRRLAVIRHAITHEFARRQPWSADIRPYDSLSACLQAVERGECDAALGMQLVTDQHIRKLGLRNVVRSPLNFPEIRYELCLAVQPGQKALLARLNRGIHALMLDRRHDALHEKWLGELEPRQLRWRDLAPYLPLAAIGATVILGALLWQRRLLTQLARQARAIRENEERLQLVFEGSQDAFWDWDVMHGRIMRSPRWAGMLGYPPAEIGVERKAFLDLVHPDDRAAILADEQQVNAGKDHFSLEFRMRAKSGEWKWIHDRGKVVARDPATGQPRRLTGTHTDITDRKLAEVAAERLHHKMLESQKLESLGLLAGGIAHDFNNLLTVILGNSTLARLESADSPANCARLDSIITSAQRAAELCRQLLAYAGKDTFTTGPVNLNTLATETARLLELTIAKNAQLETVLAPDLPPNEADASQIRQVIMNLLLNASEAIGEGPGTIRLATSAVTLGAAVPGDGFAPTTEATPGQYACLEVADTGCGMTPAVLERIFDPFYTTKFAGRGLGLAAVLGIVRTHHGTVRVTSTPGRGSVFRVYLPLRQVDTVHPFSAPAAAGPRT